MIPQFLIQKIAFCWPCECFTKGHVLIHDFVYTSIQARHKGWTLSRFPVFLHNKRIHTHSKPTNGYKSCNMLII